jgi:hypothetical protein
LSLGCEASLIHGLGFSYNGTNSAWLETLQPRIAAYENQKWNHLDSVCYVFHGPGASQASSNTLMQGYLIAADLFSSINVYVYLNPLQRPKILTKEKVPQGSGLHHGWCQLRMG